MLTLKLLRMIRVFRMLKVARLMNRLKWWVMIRFSVRSIIKFLLIILVGATYSYCSKRNTDISIMLMDVYNVHCRW